MELQQGIDKTWIHTQTVSNKEILECFYWAENNGPSVVYVDGGNGFLSQESSFIMESVNIIERLMLQIIINN